MLFKIVCVDALIEVIGEPFTIDGSEDQFCVHRSEGLDSCKYNASHCKTGFRIDGGDTINEAIDNARKRWESKGDALIKMCMIRATEVRARFDNE